MQSIIIMSKHVIDAIINHSLCNPSLECGGYLYGKRKLINDTYHFYITAYYYDKNILGTNDRFYFTFEQDLMAKIYTDSFNLDLIGFYHSHGDFPSIPSNLDKENLEHYLKLDKISIIYSPKYNTICAHTILLNGERIETPIYIKQDMKYTRFDLLYNNQKILKK